VLLPVAQPPPACHAGAAAHPFRQHPPGNATLEHEDNTCEASPVCQARSATLRLRQKHWQKRFDQTPQRIRNKHVSHVKILKSNRMRETLPRYKRVLLQALNLISISRRIEVKSRQVWET